MITPELVFAVLRHPSLWGEAIRTVLAVAPPRWWSRAPFVPLPDAEYSRWRVATAHGDPEIPLTADELVSYLRWRRSQHRPLRRV